MISKEIEFDPERKGRRVELAWDKCGTLTGRFEESYYGVLWEYVRDIDGSMSWIIG